MKYELESADNGWIVSWVDWCGWREWWTELRAGNLYRGWRHRIVFEVPDDIDLQHEDPQALIDLLYFVKEEVCGQYSSKHKKTNIRVVMEGEEC